MVAVLVSFTLILAVVLGSMALITNSVKHSRHQQDADLALSAAKSGLNDLLTLLRGNPSYLEGIQGPTDAYCDNKTGNPATGGPFGKDRDYFAEVCQWDSGTEVGWKKLLPSRQAFHYEVKSYDPITESVEAVATGRSGDVYRTVRGYLERESTEHWLYFSYYELADPNDYTTYNTWTIDPSESPYGANQLTSAGCGGGYPPPPELAKELGFRWQLDLGAGVRRTYQKGSFSFPCAEPDFVKDRLVGPVHSNDTIRASQTEFVGRRSSHDPACDPEAVAQQGGGAPPADCGLSGSGNDLSAQGALEYRDQPLDLPGTAKPAEEAVVNARGCLYQGPTRIVLKGSKMQVWSKRSEVERPGCGSKSALRSPGGAEVDIPLGEDALVYVDQLPEDVASAQNLTDDPIPSGGIGDGLPLGTYQASHKQASRDASYRYQKGMQLPAKGDTRGNLYIEGTFDTDLTVAAHGLVVLTGDLVADDKAEDLLGIISGSSVELFNPIMETYDAISAGGSSYIWSAARDVALDSTWADSHSMYDADRRSFTVDAAISAATAGFGLQNWRDGGDLGTLRVYGSIAQRFRGVVGYHDDQTGALVAGYRKDYVYNESLSKGSPLLFAPISNGTWVISWLEKATPPVALTG
jgi:hypothetical protein